MRCTVVLALLAAVAGCAPRPRADVGLRADGEGGPSADELRRDLAAFAADSFRGRRSGTSDARRAATFLAARLEALGVEPAGDSGYFQRVPLVRHGPGPAARFEVLGPGGRLALPMGESLVPMPTPLGGGPLPAEHADAELVFVGRGVPGGGVTQADLDRVDVRGRAAVVVVGAPPGTPPARRGAPAGPAEIGRRVEALIARGAAAVIVLLTGDAAKTIPLLARQYARIAEVGDLSLAPPESLRSLPMLLLGDAARAAPLLPDGWPDDWRPQALAGRRFSGALDLSVTAHNVVGVVRGREPAFRESYVAYGAHYDHIGVQREDAPGGSEAGATLADSIANGADDDGSGTVALLGVARAMHVGPRPRRSALFVWHVGEEQGLLGSEYFAAHPTVPLDSLVAQLNADMIGRNARDSLYVVGPQAAPKGQSRLLGQLVDSVNAALRPPFLINREWDSPTHPEQIYFRSDHYSYARRGVPIAFFTSGLHEDYHRVGDEAAKVDYEKLARVARLLLDVGRAVGERTTRLK